jgi:hypothetical protein
MLLESAISLVYQYISVSNSLTRRPYPIPEWISLYHKGSSTTKIAGQYQIGVSTVRRHLRRHIPLRDRITASITASTKFTKRPFSGDLCEGAFLAGFVEDCHIRQTGRLKEVSLSTTHPAMGQFFRSLFANYGHVTSLPHFEGLHGYYQYILTVYLDLSFAPFVIKTDQVPHWISPLADSPVFQSYLSGLVAAEGCIALYGNHGRTDTALTITLKKRTLLEELSGIIGGRIYKVQRASRLVIYGKAAIRLLEHLSIRHTEKVEKARLIMGHVGEQWPAIKTLWLDLREKIEREVLEYKERARFDYLEKHGFFHPKDKMTGAN